MGGTARRTMGPASIRAMGPTSIRAVSATPVRAMDIVADRTTHLATPPQTITVGDLSLTKASHTPLTIRIPSRSPPPRPARLSVKRRRRHAGHPRPCPTRCSRSQRLQADLGHYAPGTRTGTRIPSMTCGLSLAARGSAHLVRRAGRPTPPDRRRTAGAPHSVAAHPVAARPDAPSLAPGRPRRPSALSTAAPRCSRRRRSAAVPPGAPPPSVASGYTGTMAAPRRMPDNDDHGLRTRESAGAP